MRKRKCKSAVAILILLTLILFVSSCNLNFNNYVSQSGKYSISGEDCESAYQNNTINGSEQLDENEDKSHDDVDISVNDEGNGDKTDANAPENDYTIIEDDNITDDYEYSQIPSASVVVRTDFESTQVSGVFINVYAGHLGELVFSTGDLEESDLTYVLVRYVFGTHDFDYWDDTISLVEITKIEEFEEHEYSFVTIFDDNTIFMLDENGQAVKSTLPFVTTDYIDFLVNDGEYILQYDIFAFDENGKEVLINYGVEPSLVFITKTDENYELITEREYIDKILCDNN